MARFLDSCLLFVVILAIALCLSAQKSRNITVGTNITATDQSSNNIWLSANGDFALGFQQLKGNKDLFVLSIWFDKIPEKTIVWYLRDEDPVPRGSTLRLDAVTGLELRDPQGTMIYNAPDLVGEVAYGYLNDTGNFILASRNSNRLWESFKNPSDTLLPTQTIEIDGSLVSRKSEGNFSQGRFLARMDGDGNFVLKAKTAISDTNFDFEYYSSSTSDADQSNSGYQLVLDERGSLFVRRRNGMQQVLGPHSSSPVSGSYYRATMDFDGVFRHYYYPRNGSNLQWITVDSWPDNICFALEGDDVSGACGYNSVCRLDNKSPVCYCPQGFTLSDPNNAYGDCEPSLVQNCLSSDNTSSGKEQYEFLQVGDTDWPKNDYQKIKPSTEESCRNACLNDCSCLVAIYRSDTCWKKKLPLSNGRVDTSLGVKAFFKFRKGDAPLLQSPMIEPEVKQKRDRETLIVVGSALLGSSVFINILFIIAACLGFFLIYKKNYSPVPNQANDLTNIRFFTYKELEEATNGFEHELGKGSFGTVYKGVLPNATKTTTAVKKLNTLASRSEKEFRMEVNVIGTTHHKNLVRLYGFCDEGSHRLLVYEHMSNGALSGFLFNDPKKSWALRAHIALGVARGLAYLHEECITQSIIHCDIKPQNILLDEYYNARISDFGLAKLLMMNQSQTSTNIRGTKGYVAPEWFRNTQITAKVDVYSFGVVLLEIICCKRCVEDLEHGDGKYGVLTEWVYDCFQENRLDALVESDEEAQSDNEKLERFVKVGIWCIQEDASKRPSMRRAVQMLEGTVGVDSPPSPFFYHAVDILSD